jgi:hypothetical protein
MKRVSFIPLLRDLEELGLDSQKAFLNLASENWIVGRDLEGQREILWESDGGVCVRILKLGIQILKKSWSPRKERRPLLLGSEKLLIGSLQCEETTVGRERLREVMGETQRDDGGDSER